MPQYITDLQVSLNEDQEKELSEKGFMNTGVDLSPPGGNCTFIWYKKDYTQAITRIEFSFTDAMSEALKQAGYQKIPKNLNTGAGGNNIYLWFFRGNTAYDVKIPNLDVTNEDDPSKFYSGYERIACDLSQESGGHWVFLWVERENPTYICDVSATADSSGDQQLYRDGYIRLNVSTNRGAGGAYVFIWYRHTTNTTNSIKDLLVSTSPDDAKKFQDQGYHRVNTNLDQGTAGNRVFLWYKKDDVPNKPIKDVTLVVTRAQARIYEEAGVEVITKNLNAGNPGAPELFLCFYR